MDILEMQDTISPKIFLYGTQVYEKGRSLLTINSLANKYQYLENVNHELF